MLQQVASLGQGTAYDLATLEGMFASTPTQQGVFAISQDPILVPQADYNSAYNANYPGDMRAYIQFGASSFSFFNGPISASL